MSIQGQEAPAATDGETSEAPADTQNEFATFDDFSEELYSGSGAQLDEAGRDEPQPLDERVGEEAEEAQEEAPSKAKEAQDDALTAQEAKKLRAMLAEDAFEVPLEAEIEVKIDGKVEKMKLQDVLNKASGTEAVDRRFSQLDKERKEFEFIKKTLNQHAEKIKQAGQQGNHMEVVELIAEMAGMDSVDFNRAIDQAVIARYNEFFQLSEEDVESLLKARSADYITEERERKAKRKQEANRHLDESLPQLRALQQQFSQAGYSGIDDNAVSQALQGLTQANPGQKYTYVDALEVALLSEEYSQAKEVFADTNPELVNNAEALRGLQTATRMFVQQQGRKPTNEELQQVAREVYGSSVTSTEQEIEEKPVAPKADRLSRKLQESKSKQNKRASSSSPLKAFEEKYANTAMTFADLD